MAILVIAEHDNRTLNGATANLVAAAAQLGSEIDVLVAGEQAAGVATSCAELASVRKVLLAQAPHLAHGLAENLAAQVLALAPGYTHILFNASVAGKNVAPRVAACLNVNQISDVIAIVSPDTFRRPIYAGNAIATIRSHDRVIVATVRSTAFTPVSQSDAPVSIETIDAQPDAGMARFEQRALSTSDRPELSGARTVVSGGRGLGSAENFKLLDPLAAKLGAALGASRAAVDAGYAPNDWQVGQTGKIVAPDLYIAIGISGAIQHLAGMKDSKTIVAINKDADAPIFGVADYGLVSDLFEAVPALTQALG